MRGFLRSEMTNGTPNILALIPNWIGDVVMCTPALRALRRRFPEERITVAGPGSGCELVHGLPYVDELFPLPQRSAFPKLVELGRRLHASARDLAVVFPHSFRAALLARLTGARRRVGQRGNGRSWLFTDVVRPHREHGRVVPVYMASEYLHVVAALGCEDDRGGLELRADPACVAQVTERLGGAGPLVGIAPGAAFGPSKRWPADRYAAVVDRLVEEIGARCVLLTGPGEEDTRKAVVDAARTEVVVCDRGRPTIATLKATISQLDLLICNDSGPRHVAVAFGVPTVCIMGPTSPRYSAGPYERGRVLRVDVDCGPCQKPVCTTDHRCMTRITPEQVVDAARALLPR